MKEYDIYKDISERTKGDIYIGVVGPVRTGKSTFIKRFMDLAVLPNMENEYVKQRATDELPQSGAGKAIMTTEPKFVPNEAVEVNLEDNVNFKVRLIDCVGYIVPEALGYLDGENPRMVNTPWSEERIPFSQAAEIGTKKVITDHSTIGFVITTDGSITDIEREAYTEAEEKVIEELKNINKPFIIILNTNKPFSKETENLVRELEEKYSVPVIPLNCANLKNEDINNILERILYEFPVSQININLPKWVETLDTDHYIKKSIIDTTRDSFKDVYKLRDSKNSLLRDNEYIKKSFIDSIDLGTGCCNIDVSLNEDLFFKVLSETTDTQINSEYELISIIKELSLCKKSYDKIKNALEEVERNGYGVVMPSMSDTLLDTPEVSKHGSKYGIKIKATAPSIHMIRADIQTEVNPIVGTEQQSKDLCDYLKEELTNNMDNVWEYNIFGKSLYDLVNDGLNSKLYHMPHQAQEKLQETLEKIINEGSGGLICIIL